MGFVLSDEEDALRETVRRWARERVPVAHLRALRDGGDPVGFSRERWRELAALGGVGLWVPERWGGVGLGWAALGLVVEELGRSLAPLPWLSALLGGGALLDGGSDAQKQANLPSLCAGERIVALAHDEGTRFSRTRVTTSAERAPGGFRLRGEKVMVLDGHVADAFVVSARTGGAAGDDTGAGVTLFLVDAAAKGLAVERTAVVDSRNAARVTLDGVFVGEAEVVGGVDRAGELLGPLFDRAALALSAEMLGGAEEVFARTLQHLKTRRQFGVPIGSFQALQHRTAFAYCEVELLRSVVREGLCAVDEKRDDVPLLACAAKARASDAFLHCAAEAVQLHGGIGVTDELDIGLYYKRARVAAMLLGDAPWQRDRFARVSGY
jgi:alkylation response protein AidB-like acyl-CoA dehydrogenase